MPDNNINRTFYVNLVILVKFGAREIDPRGKKTIIFVPRIMRNTVSFVVVKTALYEPTSNVGDAIKCELLFIYS